MGHLNPFKSSTHLISSSFHSQSALPDETHITGIVGQVKPPTYETSRDPTTGHLREAKPRVELMLHCELPSDATIINDYAVVPTSTTIAAGIIITLYPSNIQSGDEVNEMIREMLDEASNEAKSCIGKKTTISTGDMIVMDIKQAKVLQVTLKSQGERVIKLKGRDPVFLLRGGCTDFLDENTAPYPIAS